VKKKMWLGRRRDGERKVVGREDGLAWSLFSSVTHVSSRLKVLRLSVPNPTSRLELKRTIVIRVAS